MESYRALLVEAKGAVFILKVSLKDIGGKKESKNNNKWESFVFSQLHKQDSEIE